MVDAASLYAHVRTVVVVPWTKKGNNMASTGRAGSVVVYQRPKG